MTILLYGGIAVVVEQPDSVTFLEGPVEFKSQRYQMPLGEVIKFLASVFCHSFKKTLNIHGNMRLLLIVYFVRQMLSLYRA